jgi:hypothetical protein
MEEELNDITGLWKKGKSSQVSGLTSERIIDQANTKMKNSLMAHYGNIAIMGAMAILIFVFYFVLYPMATALSNAGICLMLAALIVRVGIEIVSLRRSKIVRIAKATVNAAEESRKFYEFRKRMHGTVTIVLVGLYIVGWFMLTPEYSRHISGTWLLIMDGGFVVIAAVLITVIRKGLQAEIADLQHLADLQRQLESQN